MILLTLAIFILQETDIPAPVAPDNSSALAEMFHNSGPMALAVLGILLLASLFSWSIMLSKWSSFRRAQAQSFALLISQPQRHRHAAR